MPRDPQVLIFVGIRDTVVALDDRSGAEVWRAELRARDFVSIYWDGEALIAANSGEIWRLDPRNGAVIWHNELKGLGRGLVSLTTSRQPGSSSGISTSVEKIRRDAQAAAESA
jgi:outer membrane protein assembly factor BamB